MSCCHTPLSKAASSACEEAYGWPRRRCTYTTIARHHPCVRRGRRCPRGREVRFCSFSPSTIKKENLPACISEAMAHNPELWVLEFLLDQDVLSEAGIRQLHDKLVVRGGHDSKTLLVRHALRILRETAANVTLATLKALNWLGSRANASIEWDLDSPPNAILLAPPIELCLQVRTQLVLRCLRAGPVEAILQSEAPREQLEKLFPTTQHPQPATMQRKEELAIGLATPAGAQALLEKYRNVVVEQNILKYVAEGRAAIGPPFLKVVEDHMESGLYHPYHQDATVTLAAALVGEREQLARRREALFARTQELAARERRLMRREEQVAAREGRLAEREDQLAAREHAALSLPVLAPLRWSV